MEREDTNMMQKILEALADVNLQLIKQPIDHNLETSQAMIKMGELRTALEAALSDSEKELFQKLKETSDGVNMNYATARFVTGFRLGALMMIEVFSGSDNLIAH